MKLSNSYNELYEEIRSRKVPFLVVFFLAVLLTYGILYAADFIPEAPALATSTAVAVTEKATTILQSETKEPQSAVAPSTVSQYPVKIIFDSLQGKTVNVSNPTSQSNTVLDNALLKGAVRYPTSADFSSPGNIFILAHSSYLPTVFNKNYQSFNGIQNLVWGDTIRLQSTDTEYVYQVQKVYKANISDVVVPQTPGKAELTLATCNSFATKDDRFIVVAYLVNSHPL